MDLPISTFQNNFIIKTFKAKYLSLEIAEKEQYNYKGGENIPQFTHYIQSLQDFGLNLLNFANLGDDEKWSVYAAYEMACP